MTKRLPIHAPNTGRVFAHWRPMTHEAVEAAVDRADRALDALKRLDARRELLDGFVSAMLHRRARLAELIVEEAGKKPIEAAGEVDYAVSFLTAARRAIEEIDFETSLGDERSIRLVPYRSALLIAPFNDPLAGLTRKIGPAIAAGAPALVKPSRLAMLCAEALFESIADAGLGDCVRLIAPEDNRVIETLIADRRIGTVSFTGSTGTGRRIAAAAAEHGKKAILELGGNCPFVICDDADLDLAVDDLIVRKLKAAGQACSSVNRVFVAASRYADFKARLLAKSEALRLGRSDSPGIDLGPLRTRAATEALGAAVERALRNGESLLTDRPPAVAPDTPFLFPFTVIETDGESLFESYETFGPLLSIRAFQSLDDLLVRLERERHALVAYFYCGDPDALLPRLGRLRFGSLGLNSTAVQGPDVPTGGFWQAGIGREGGRWGVGEFLAPINHRIHKPGTARS